jgi:hypothetical protein
MAKNEDSSYKQIPMFSDQSVNSSIQYNTSKDKNMKTYSKETLIKELLKIRESGWIMGSRQGNVGDVGNLLEDLLGIEENNLPIPNAAEWELKCQRINSTSLTTLFHKEPSPTAFRFVPQILLPKYGWPHQSAGTRYPKSEMSFRQTINGNSYSSRGFIVKIDRDARKVLISFDSSKVAEENTEWLLSVEKRVGLNELNPQPYWGFDDLFHKAGTKLLNCFYLLADRKKEKGNEYFWYKEIYMLQNFKIEKFVDAIEKGYVYVDFDARTGHNHGTKFRLRRNHLTDLYENATSL